VSAPVFADLVGQEQVIQQLEQAINTTPNSPGNVMTHAWLFTGPPGSGRSNIAKAFASSLVCKKRGCGTCDDCRTALVGTHPDIELVDVSGLYIKIDEIREIVTRSSWGASTSNWRVVVIEDCDRMTEAAANALLKALEEPGASTIWLLCAPTLHDVLPTVRSRCRHLNLKTPTTNEITTYLVEKMHVTQEEAESAASISQGHIGKARAYLLNPEIGQTNERVLELLFTSTSEKNALKSASDLLTIAEQRVESKFAEQIEKENEDIKSAHQGTNRGLISGGSKVLKDLEKEQKFRKNRAIKDELDGFLLTYAIFLRDKLLASGMATKSQEATLRLISYVNEARNRLNTNTSQTLLLESFFLQAVGTLDGKKHAQR
jgi:DNA polymerase-3 subunit delta'